jgi:aspartyl-tRNA(Asn)/glutamyl-tRNA(Gln) amidotransferase subunit B
LGKLFDELIEQKADAVVSARILTREILAVLNHDSLSWKDVSVKAEDLSELVGLLKEGKVSDKNAKQAIINYISGDKSKPVEYLKKNNLLISELINLDLVIEKVLGANEKAVNDYKAGNQKSLNFLSGLIMKETKGTANIRQVLEKLNQKLN